MTDTERLEHARTLFNEHRANMASADTSSDDLACLAYAIVAYAQQPLTPERGMIVSAYVRTAFLLGKATAQPVIDAALEYATSDEYQSNYSGRFALAIIAAVEDYKEQHP